MVMVMVVVMVIVVIVIAIVWCVNEGIDDMDSFPPINLSYLLLPSRSLSLISHLSSLIYHLSTIVWRTHLLRSAWLTEGRTLV